MIGDSPIYSTWNIEYSSCVWYDVMKTLECCEVQGRTNRRWHEDRGTRTNIIEKYGKRYARQEKKILAAGAILLFETWRMMPSMISSLFISLVDSRLV